MPRDIRNSTPAFETLRFVAAICMGRTSRQTRRDFAGYAVGKRRKFTVIPYIALDMAREIMRAVNVENGGLAVIPEEIAAKIEAVLLNISDEEAFKLASHVSDEKEEIVGSIADQVRAMMLSDYAVTEIEKEPEFRKPDESNGWRAYECIKVDEKPRYKWRHTWADRNGNDLVGYKDGACIGRVFRIDYTIHHEKWFWLVEHVPLQRPERESRTAGWERSAREAACRAENCFEAIMRLNGKQA
ncbi:hypothetical protein [Rhizobium rhizogenes]|uniref:hypothetical protein n=1 Tax=Rhizobium rhizogenes TaxID=359 RepID=UPI0015718F1E|nr:hypothetical protein [Rhizobium rhizogenes]NTF92615.1 hypothetical protein [Rhizobium rhizogenes]